MKYSTILSQSNYMIVNKTLAKKIGLINSIIVSNLCSLEDKYGDGFFFSQEEMADTCCVCLDTIKKSLSFLKKEGYLEIEKKGLPCKNYYSFTKEFEKYIENLLVKEETNKLDDNNSNKLDDFSTNKEMDNNTNNINNTINNNYNKESTNVDKKENEIQTEIFQNPDYIAFRKWMKDNCSFCNNPKNFTASVITENEFLKLKEHYTGKEIADVISEIENRKDLRKKYSNLYKTTQNWLKNRNNNGSKR